MNISLIVSLAFIYFKHYHIRIDLFLQCRYNIFATLTLAKAFDTINHKVDGPANECQDIDGAYEHVCKCLLLVQKWMVNWHFTGEPAICMCLGVSAARLVCRQKSALHSLACYQGRLDAPLILRSHILLRTSSLWLDPLIQSSNLVQQSSPAIQSTIQSSD